MIEEKKNEIRTGAGICQFWMNETDWPGFGVTTWKDQTRELP